MSRNQRRMPESLIPVVEQLNSIATKYGGRLAGNQIIPEWNEALRTVGSRDPIPPTPSGHRVILTYQFSPDNPENKTKFQVEANALLVATKRAVEINIGPQPPNNVIVSFLWLYRQE